MTTDTRTTRPSAHERVLQRSICEIATRCWLYLGGCKQDGYGVAQREDGRSSTSHRVVYEALVGPVPADCDLHHLCHTRTCCNPEHVRPIARGDHRRLHPRPLLARATIDGVEVRRCPTCGETKPATAEHFYLTKSGRVFGYCRPCHNAYTRAKAHERAPAVLTDAQKAKHRVVARLSNRRRDGITPDRYRPDRIKT